MTALGQVRDDVAVDALEVALQGAGPARELLGPDHQELAHRHARAALLGRRGQLLELGGDRALRVALALVAPELAHASVRRGDARQPQAGAPAADGLPHRRTSLLVMKA